MSDLVFLDVMPPPLQGGFTRAADVSSQKIQFEVGLGRKRRSIRATPKLVDVVWDIPFEMYRPFDDWFVDTAMNGAATFDIFIEGLWWEANFVDTPGYKATIDQTLLRVVIESKLVLGVGPASGIAVRSNTVDLAVSMVARAFASATGQFTTTLSASLSAGVQLTAEPSVIAPFTATLTAGTALQADNGAALDVLLLASAYLATTAVAEGRSTDAGADRTTDTESTRDLG